MVEMVTHDLAMSEKIEDIDLDIIIALLSSVTHFCAKFFFV